MLFKVILYATLFMSTRCRPRLVEGNDSETRDEEYEGSDDTAANDYLHEDQESTMDEVQRKSRRHEVTQDFQKQGSLRDVNIAEQQSFPKKDSYESFSDTNSGPQNEKTHGEYRNINNERGIASERGHPGMFQPPNDEGNEAEGHEIFTQSKSNQLKRTQSESSLDPRSFNTASDYGSEMLFKLKSAQVAGANEMPEEASDQPNEVEQYNIHSRNSDQTGAKRFEKIFDRDRRHVPDVKERKISDDTNPSKIKETMDTDESSENAIITGIKKLSEQDLEELLNLLPEDKKMLLKKIMDKREITKKAGAVDENNYAEGGQSDTSKIEAGYSVKSYTESSVSSNTPESTKQTENGEGVNTKNPESESGSGTSGGKSEMGDTDLKDERSAIGEESERFIEDSINGENIDTDPNKISKTDTKRETKNKETSLEDSKNSDYEFYIKGLKDFPVNQEDNCSENEAWFESKNEELKENEGQVRNFKRGISQKDPSALSDCVKSLEDSFPAYSNNDNSLQSEMAPLIRVKRTEKDRLKLQDSSFLSNGNVHYSPGDDNYENEENSEYVNNGDRSINFNKNQDVSSKDTVLDIGEIQQQSTKFNKLNSLAAKLRPTMDRKIQKMKIDNLSLVSDTDSVILGVEGVNDNLMYNSGLRNRRTPKYSNIDDKNSIRIERTAGPINVGSISDNSISEYHENEAFGSLSSNVEENLNRHKRVRNIDVFSSREANSEK